MYDLELQAKQEEAFDRPLHREHVEVFLFSLALEDSYKLSLPGDAVGPTSCYESNCLTFGFLNPARSSSLCMLEHQKNFMTVAGPR